MEFFCKQADRRDMNGQTTIITLLTATHTFWPIYLQDIYKKSAGWLLCNMAHFFKSFSFIKSFTYKA